MTSFYTKNGAYKRSNGKDMSLEEGDIAVGNYGAGPNTPNNGLLAPGASDRPAYPPGSVIGVYPDDAPSFNGRVSDWGAYNILHPQVPTNGWIDIWHADGERNPQSHDGWISFGVRDNCPCPDGSSEHPEGAPKLSP